MNRIYIKEQAREQIRGKIGILFLIYLVIALITSVSGLIPIVGPFLVTGAFSLSWAKIYLRLGEGETKVGDAFSGFEDFFPAFKLFLLTGFLTCLWSLLFVIPGIVKAFSYSMARYVLAENPGMSAMECLKRSEAMTKGHKWELFVLLLSFFWWYLLETVTFGIASIYVTPYVDAAYANAYRLLGADTKAQSQAEWMSNGAF